MNIIEYAKVCANVLDKKHGRDVEVIDVGGKSAFVDYIVIASAGNERLLAALVNEVEDVLAKDGLLVKHIEGKKESGWILMDYGDIIVNVLTLEMREKYNIEKIWADCDFLEWKEEN